jgi:S-formylglutathione hydrolase FrmB
LIPAFSLKNNKLGDPVQQEIRIFLPPSYYSTQKRFPVVYYLHGFNSSFLEIDWYKSQYKAHMKDKKANEFILVGVNGRNKLGGSFYVNSPVTGSWEDYVVRDVIRYVDSKYRTIPDASSRGLSGFSMGGFASLNIAFHHPDVFSSIFAISPSIFDKKDITRVLKTMNQQMVTAYGAAFAPNINTVYPFADIPKLNNSKQDNEILLKWINGTGNMNEKAKLYLDNIKQLANIRIEYGDKDFFDWIPHGCKQLSNSLTANTIKNELLKFNGSHGDKNNIIVKQNMFPYFSRVLKGYRDGST